MPLNLAVKICIETHIGSLTMSIRDTLRMVEDVNMSMWASFLTTPGLNWAGEEFGREAVRRAAGHIFHVHIKDWKLESRIPLKKTSCLMGEGTVAWEKTLAELKRTGYTGYVSDEYEKYWYPQDLPEPEIGMRHNLEFVKARLL